MPVGGKRILWSQDEESTLKLLYATNKKALICESIPNRSWDGIKLHAAVLGLKKKFNEYIEADLSAILQETPEAYYWAGFISGDGSINHEVMRLKVALAPREAYHVKKLAKFINCNSYKGGSCVSVQDKYLVPQIANKFDLKPQKTYNPPTRFSFASHDLFISYLCGFIDADGCIRRQTGRTDCAIMIKLHASWILFLDFLSSQLYNYLGIEGIQKASVNSAGYAHICFSDMRIVRHLKLKVSELALPLLTRKWDKIDETRFSRYEKTAINWIYIRRMLFLGTPRKQIAKRLGISEPTISLHIKRKGGFR